MILGLRQRAVHREGLLGGFLGFNRVFAGYLDFSTFSGGPGIKQHYPYDDSGGGGQAGQKGDNQWEGFFFEPISNRLFSLWNPFLELCPDNAKEAGHFLARQLGRFYRVIDDLFSGQRHGNGERIVRGQFVLRLFRFVWFIVFVHRVSVSKVLQYKYP